jgi:hypothetical protein
VELEAHRGGRGKRLWRWMRAVEMRLEGRTGAGLVLELRDGGESGVEQALPADSTRRGSRRRESVV